MVAHTHPSRVAYVHLGQTHLEYTEAVSALAARGVEAKLVHLDEAATTDWAAFDLVNIRMCRGFHLDDGFLARIEALDTRLRALPGRPVRLANPLRLVRGALDKRRYLTDLEEEGVDIIPTRWVDRGAALTLEEVMRETGWEHVVVKPAISSRSWQTFRVSRGGVSTAPDTHLVLEAGGTDEHERRLRSMLRTHDVCVQRFMPDILARGELSFVFMGGSFSHAVRKTVGTGGGWFAHELLGGVNQPLEASPAQREWAERVYAAIVRRYGPLHFARVDGIAGEDGRLRLLECELVIPRLLLREGNAFSSYAEAILRALED
jgi:glutathione synthase/RimK-type ligase-like ATP-grasp enzyme